jgi:hypothetical protein
MSSRRNNSTSRNNSSSVPAGNKRNQNGGAHVKSQMEKAKADDTLTCKSCLNVFTDSNDKLVECEKCENWECQDCAQISDVEYGALQLAGSKMHWYCGECNEEAISAVKTAELIKTTCLKYVSELRVELIEHTDVKRRELKEEIDRELMTIREELHEVREEVKTTRVGDLAEKNLKEMELRESKKLNVVFFNVEESKASVKEEAIREDKERLDRIQEVMKTSTTLTNITRLGAKANDKTRPLKATLNTAKDHRDLLKAAKNLRGSDFNDIYVSRDLTPLERENWKKLVKERKEKQEESEEKNENVRWVIFKGQVVKGRTGGPPEVKEEEE